MSDHTYDVAVVGCGLMGAALAQNFAANGLKVAAWNRTHSKAEALAGNGISAIADITQVVRSSPLVVVCTATYESAHEALSPVADWSSTTLVSVGSGTPADAEELQDWATLRGASYLDGAVLCYPQQIGTDGGMILYSGSPEAWAAHEPVLVMPGQHSTLISDNVKAASVLDAAIIGGFYSAALSAYVEAATYALDQGVDPGTLNAISEMALQTLAATAKEAVDAIATDNHTTDTATLGTYAAGCRGTLNAIESSGHKARLLEAAITNLTEAEQAGLGDLGFFALTKIARGV